MHPGVEIARGHILDRNAREIQANHCHHGTGDHWRHEALDPVGSDRLHDDTDQRAERPAGHDAAEGQADLLIHALSRISRGRNHHTDESEARAQVTRHPPTCDQEKDQGADAAHEDGNVRIETHQDRGQHGRTEHGDHMLYAHHGSHRPGQTLVGCNHTTLLKYLSVFLGPAEHRHCHCSR